MTGRIIPLNKWRKRKLLSSTNMSSKLEKRKIAMTFSCPSNNIVRINFIFMFYLHSEKGIPHGNFSAVATKH